MRISDMAKVAQSNLFKVDEQEVQQRAANRRPKNLMMNGNGDFKDASEADAPPEMRGKVIDLVRNEFVNNYGKSDGKNYINLIRSWARQFPDDADISKAVHGMYKMNLSENSRLEKLAEDNFPGWKPGQPFNKEKMWELIANSIDIKV